MGCDRTRRRTPDHGGIIPKNLAYASLLETLERAATPEGRRAARLALNRFAALAHPERKK